MTNKLNNSEGMKTINNQLMAVNLFNIRLTFFQSELFVTTIQIVDVL